MKTTNTRFALPAALLLPGALLAQSGAGSIQGTVQDVSSAATCNCAVHAVNQSMGVANDTSTNTTGFYSAQACLPAITP